MTDATVETGARTTCPVCGEEVNADAKFCEACGAELVAADGSVASPGTASALPESSVAVASRLADVEGEGHPAACPNCGGTIAPDGYCERCGERAPLWRDHFEETSAPGLAMVCDRGIRHRRNEDAGLVAVLPSGATLLVVCDGVSSSMDSDVASLAAVRATAQTLIRALPPRASSESVTVSANQGADPASGAPTEPLPVANSTPAASGGDVTSSARVTRAGVIGAALAEAAEAANSAVVDSVRAESADNPPSCTFVAGVLEATEQGALLVVGWIGDSRAYWIPDASTGHAPERLTTDDSWAAEEIALGVPREEAESGPHAHAITRWLGADAPETRPRTNSRLLDRPGWVVVCSDGLWNYCSEPASLTATFRSVEASIDGSAGEVERAIARGLVAWANGQGGQDNITVALARVDVPGPTANSTN